MSSEEISNERVKEVEEKSKREIGIVMVLALMAVILFSQSMFSVFNSLSNLGALNLSSLALMLLIDQMGVRMSLLGIMSIAVYIIEVSQKNPFSFNFILYLCEQQLIEEMNRIDNEKPEEKEMGASPIKKKTSSPSKVPRVPLYFEQETIMQLSSKREEEGKK